MQVARSQVATFIALTILLVGNIGLNLVFSLLRGSYIIRSSGTLGPEGTRPLHTEGRYIKDDLGNIVILRGVFKAEFVDSSTGWWTRSGYPISEDGYYNFEEDAVRENFRVLRDVWGANILATYFWADWWINNASTTELGGRTSHSLRQSLKGTIDIAQEYGIYVSVRVYSPKQGEGRVEFPFPTGMQYEHDGSIFPNADAFANFWGDMAQELSVYPNVIFNLYDEPGTNLEAWIDVADKTITAIRNRGVDHLVMVQWGYCGEMDWVDEYVEKGKRTDNVVFWNHIYRYHGTFDSINKSTDLNSIRNFIQADNVPRYTYPPTGLHYKHVVDVLNLPMWVGAIGAANGDTDDAEYTAFKNTLTVLNEMDIGYVAYQWHRSDWMWPLQQDTAAIQPPNRVGQALIDAIAAGTP